MDWYLALLYAFGMRVKTKRQIRHVIIINFFTICTPCYVYLVKPACRQPFDLVFYAQRKTTITATVRRT